MNHEKHKLDFMTIEVHLTSLLLLMILEAEEIERNTVLLAGKVKIMNAGSVQKILFVI